MKKWSILKNCMALAAAVMMFSCTQSPLDKLNAFVDRNVEEAANYTEEEWQQSEEEFEQIMEDLKANYEEMTEQERKEALNAVGRYCGIQTKRGLKSAADEVNKALESLPSLVEGFTDAFKDDDEK